MAVLIRVDKNGTKYYEGQVPCSRCGGAGGADKWMYTGYTCYQCGGSGKMQGKYKVYTPEYEAKLEARRRARWAEQEKRWKEEEAKREAERKAKEEAERIAREAEEARIKAQKAISQYVGEIGQKLEADVILEKRAWYEAPSYMGYGTETRYVYTFRDDKGDAIVWKTGKGITTESGTRVHIKGTVKEHSEYADEKQTVLTRCKIMGEA